VERERERERERETSKTIQGKQAEYDEEICDHMYRLLLTKNKSKFKIYFFDPTVSGVCGCFCQPHASHWLLLLSCLTGHCADSKLEQHFSEISFVVSLFTCLSAKLFQSYFSFTLQEPNSCSAMLTVGLGQ
jgi:hypothetical protein